MKPRHDVERFGGDAGYVSSAQALPRGALALGLANRSAVGESRWVRCKQKINHGSFTCP